MQKNNLSVTILLPPDSHYIFSGIFLEKKTIRGADWDFLKSRGGGGAAICSKWSGYTANNISFWDHTAVGIVTRSICRCSLPLLCVLVMPALLKKESLGMRLLQEEGVGGECPPSHAKHRSFSQIYIRRV